MVKRELAKDPELKHENWDRFLPNFQRRNLSKRRKPHKITDKSKKVYTPFPPAPEKSKIDKQLETGEYFLSKQVKEQALREKKEEQRKEKKVEKMVEREKDFVPPKEDGEGEKKKSKKRGRGEHGQGAGEVEANGNEGKKKSKDKKQRRENGEEKSSKKRKVEVEIR